MKKILILPLLPFIALGLCIASTKGHAGHTAGLCAGVIAIAISVVVGITLYVTLIGGLIYLICR